MTRVEYPNAESTVASQPPIGKVLTTDPQQFMQADGWQQFVHSSGLNGISKQILMNMIPTSVTRKIVNLTLDSASKHLFNNNRLKKIEQHCKDNLLLDIRFKVDIDDLGESAGETPTQQLAREQKQKQDTARQAFTHDPHVQELVELFDAEIIAESIKSE